MAHALTRTPEPGLDRLVRRPTRTAVLLSAAMTVVLVIRDTNDGPAWRVSLVLAASIALMTWLVFGVVVKRAVRRDQAASAARRALTLTVVG